jgi:hypothetical protein
MHRDSPKSKNAADNMVDGVLLGGDLFERLPVGCHSGGKTWEFVAMAGNRWNPISGDGYATFSVFAGDS